MNCRKLLRNVGMGSLIALPIVLMTATVAEADNNLTIHNHTQSHISELYVSPEWSRYWGNDRLYTNLKPGDSITLSFKGATCVYDLLAKDGNGNEVPPGGFGGLNLCETNNFALTNNSIRVVKWP
ncbi:MAG: hypothetical protein QNJ64_10255 [Crocosphaera sp.]|nr:hypothetical protein [Crocosphaera sp.]